MNAVDTDVLVRLLVRDGPIKSRAPEEFIARGAWVSPLVFAETVWVLDSVYQLGRQQISIAVQMLLDHVSIVLQVPDVVATALGPGLVKPRRSMSPIV